MYTCRAGTGEDDNHQQSYNNHQQSYNNHQQSYNNQQQFQMQGRIPQCTISTRGLQVGTSPVAPAPSAAAPAEAAPVPALSTSTNAPHGDETVAPHDPVSPVNSSRYRPAVGWDTGTPETVPGAGGGARAERSPRHREHRLPPLSRERRRAVCHRRPPNDGWRTIPTQ